MAKTPTKPQLIAMTYNQYREKGLRHTEAVERTGRELSCVHLVIERWINGGERVVTRAIVDIQGGKS